MLVNNSYHTKYLLHSLTALMSYIVFYSFCKNIIVWNLYFISTDLFEWGYIDLIKTNNHKLLW